VKLEWSDAVSVGHDKIDHQHRELFRVFNAFTERCAKGDARSTLIKLHDSLQKYVKIHFRNEEALMQQSKYPGYSQHKRDHQNFQLRLNEIREEIDAEGPTLMSLVLTNKVLADWLIQHVQDKDQRFGAFLKTKA